MTDKIHLLALVLAKLSPRKNEPLAIRWDVVQRNVLQVGRQPYATYELLTPEQREKYEHFTEMLESPQMDLFEFPLEG